MTQMDPHPKSPGARLRAAVLSEIPLQIIGVMNAYVAMMAEQVGYQALYLSGAGVANYAFGLPDLGITSLNDVLQEAQKIVSATDLPLLVDADTGWGGAFHIARTVKQMIRVGVAGIHIEDQVQSKRCGHRPAKQIVSEAEMVDRIKAAVDARCDPEFVIMARTDALANEGMDRALERLQRCIEAGADMVFPEAVHTLAEYQHICDALEVPVLANITEFGMTPLFTLEELRSAGVDMVLYPLSAARAMNLAALQVLKTIREEGTQKTVLSKMQTRESLYQFLDYYAYEAKLDALYEKSSEETKGD